MKVVNEVDQMRQVLHKLRTIKKCYCCVSVTDMFNSCDTRDTISSYQWFDRTGNMHRGHQQASENGDEKKWKVTQMSVLLTQKQAAGAYYKSVCMEANK